MDATHPTSNTDSAETTALVPQHRTCAACDLPILAGDPVAPGRASYHRACHSAMDAEWRSTPEGRASRAATRRLYRERHPDREAARRAVRQQVRSGLWLPARLYACVSCGDQAAHYDHAHGYEREHWLHVEPVCESCHYERRVMRGEVRGREPDRAQVGAVIPEILADYHASRAAYEAGQAGRQRHRDAFRAWLRAQTALERGRATS